MNRSTEPSETAVPTTTAWRPTWTMEERLRIALVPAWLHLAYLAAHERWRGEREFGLLPLLTPRNRVALDIGANKGVWSHALARLARRVHAFEPNPKIFPELQRALAGKVDVHPIALSDSAGMAEFRLPRSRRGYSNQGGSISSVAVNGAYGVTQVPTARLDDLGIEDVGFIKIDVEGAEFEVLRGASETLGRDRPTLVVELEERHGKRPIEAMIGDVAAMGYDPFALLDGVLRRCETIDFDARHRFAASRSDYLYNFIFLARP